MAEERERGFTTRAVHGARIPDVEQTRASVPIYQTSSWRFDSSEDYADVISFRRRGYVYGRGYRNPPVEAFEALMADLEGTEAAYGFASGMAAIHTVVTSLAKAGDRVVASPELYGGAYSLFHRISPRFGIDVDFVSPHDPEALSAALPGAALFYVETIANPNVTVADLAELGERCRAAGVPAVVDNTFASPALCNPAALGFGHVVHSATKYIGGHLDLVGGVVCCSGEARGALRQMAIDTGGAMEAFPAWLAMRGLVTLDLRMRRHCASAMAVAEFLEGHPKVERVHYPGLASHPHHEVAARELRGGFGGMVAFEIEGGTDSAVRFCDSLELAWVGASLGGHRTLVGHAASTTHRQLDAEARRAAGIADGLIRMSVGLEDPDDLLDDVERALEKA